MPRGKVATSAPAAAGPAPVAAAIAGRTGAIRDQLIGVQRELREPTRRLSARCYPRSITIVLSSVRRSRENRPPTRPTPLIEPARPPKGRWDSQ